MIDSGATEVSTSFTRTTLIGRYSDLQPSVTFWRDVMGFDYGGDPTAPNPPQASALGYNEKATVYFAKFTAANGSTVGLLMIDDAPDFPQLDSSQPGAYGGVVLVHQTTNLKAINASAVEHGVEILRPLHSMGQEGVGAMHLRAPTGHVIALYEPRVAVTPS